jgi:hypothetical protein
MHARVATFEGGEPDQIRQTIEGIQERGASGPPEGVPSVGLLLLHRADEGKVMTIGLFETEEDLRQGDETLSSMDPPAGSPGQRVSVEMYEVGVKFDAAAD